MGYTEEAFELIEKTDITAIRYNNYVMGLYLSLLTDRNLEKAVSLRNQINQQDSSLGENLQIENEGLNEEDLL